MAIELLLNLCLDGIRSAIGAILVPYLAFLPHDEGGKFALNWVLKDMMGPIV